MLRKRYSTEQIITKLRQAEVELRLCLSDGAHAGRPGVEDLDRTVATRVQPGAATQCVGLSPPPAPEAIRPPSVSGLFMRPALS